MNTSPFVTRFQRNSPKFGSGFTLIELLVVIAIIAILAAILFPVFARARENARRSNCQSNEKQIALGFLQYSQDYDSRFPYKGLDYDGNGGFSSDEGWAVMIQPYLKSTQLFQCPSEKTGISTSAAVTLTDYIYNEGLVGQNESAFAATALTVLTTDYNSNNTYYALNPCGSATLWAPTPDGTSDFYHRHLEGLNVSFVDGHVKWFKPESIKANASVTAGNPTWCKS